MKTEMEKTKKRRQDREKNRLNAKLLQHEQSARINKGEDPALVNAEIELKTVKTETKEEKAGEKIPQKEDKSLQLAKKL